MRRLLNRQKQGRSDLLERLQETASMTRCPYYRGVGICNQGCYSEPACRANGPFDPPTPRELRYIRRFSKCGG